jgi:hypothetical protein
MTAHSPLGSKEARTAAGPYIRAKLRLMHRGKQALIKSLPGKRAASEKRVDSFLRNAPVGEGGTRSFSGRRRRRRVAGGRDCS